MQINNNNLFLFQTCGFFTFQNKKNKIKIDRIEGIEKEETSFFTYLKQTKFRM